MLRFFDLTVAVTGLVILTPLFLALIILIAATDGLPVLFCQQRVGKGKTVFTLFKLRTMANGDDLGGPSLTLANDGRVTRVGRVLRKYRLDEIPQLFNILIGQMSIVGPRPEVPSLFCQLESELQDGLSAIKPGLTDIGTLVYRDEAARYPNNVDPHVFYISDIAPKKYALSLRYGNRRSLVRDVAVLALTAGATVGLLEEERIQRIALSLLGEGPDGDVPRLFQRAN